MRISDKQTFRNYLKYYNTARDAAETTDERIASGKRFTRISDDVSAATRALRVDFDQSKAEDYYDNVKSVNEKLSTTETAMMSINSILVKAHTKVLSAITNTSGDSGRQAVAIQLIDMRDEILQYANTNYNGTYVLGGSSASTAPFTLDESGNVLYNGIDVNTIKHDDNGYYYMDGSDRKEIPMDKDIYVDVGLGITMNGSTVNSGTAMKTSYSGLDLFQFGKGSDGKTNNVFNILTQLADNLKDYDADKVEAYDNKLKEFRDNFGGNLTDIGAKTSFLNTIEKRIDGTINTYQSQIKRLVGVDDAKESSNQAQNDYVMKAVLAIGAKILPVSLMDFVR